MSKQKEGKVVMDLYKILDFVFDKNEKRDQHVELEETFIPAGDSDTSPLELAQRIKRELTYSHG